MPSCICSFVHWSVSGGAWKVIAEGLGRGVAHLTMAVVMVATQYGTEIGEHTIALVSSRMAYKVAICLLIPITQQYTPGTRCPGLAG